jgi:hypothetical protein
MYFEINFFLNYDGPTKSYDSFLALTDDAIYSKFYVSWNMLLVIADFERCLRGLITLKDPFI